MIAMTTNYNDAINASKRIIKAKAELFLDSALVATYTQNDAIKSINIDRVGEDSKFFGVGITHKVNIKLIDVNREINLTTNNYFKIQIGIELNDGSIEYVSFPKFYITEVNRQENTNELSITAYDVLDKAKTATINDLELTKPYSIRNVVEAVGAKIGANKTILGKNLFDKNKVQLGKSWHGGGNAKRCALILEYEPNKAYAISLLNFDNLSSVAIVEASEITGTGSVYTKTFSETFTFTHTMNANAKYLCFQMESDTTFTKEILDNIKIQIEEGAAVTNFEPYLFAFDTEYTDGANFEGTETLQETLQDAAEATQTIYFIDSNDNLVFKRLDRDGEAVKTISKANYITLDSSTNRRLATICHATELGDNVSASKMEKSNKTINVDLSDYELCSIGDVKDELVVQNGIAKIIKKIGKVVLNGSEDWVKSTNSTTKEIFFRSSIISGFVKKWGKCISNYFIYSDASYNDISIPHAIFMGHDGYQLLIKTQGITTVEDFKNWLSSHNTKVIYELATAEEIDFDISGYNLADGVYYGESTQETRNGKNLLKPSTESFTYGGLTGSYNPETDTFNIKGTTNTTNGISVPLTDLMLNLKKGVSYTQSVITISGTQNMDVVPAVINSDGTITYNYFVNNMTKTPDEDLTTYTYNAFIKKGSGVEVDWTFKVQLEESSTATNYEPYGVSPSPDYPSEIVNKETIDANILYPITGTTQYVRDNPFWELREDIADLLEDAKDAISGITINQFNCSWRGDLSLEPGDKIALVTKDNNTVISYLLNDVITYNGGLSQKSEWQYTDGEESESNPNNLGEAIKQTFAKVDKANKQIDLLVSEVANNSSSISSLQMSTDAINATVQKDINELTTKVNATMSAEDVKIEIKNEIANGTDKVVTKTGFTFDEEGLTVSKDGSEMTTTVNEDGMTVYRDNDEMLKANNEGVIAYNLHAKTYLIVGESSRFEDYEKDGETRTGCFWIGGE